MMRKKIVFACVALAGGLVGFAYMAIRGHAFYGALWLIFFTMLANSFLEKVSKE